MKHFNYCESAISVTHANQSGKIHFILVDSSTVLCWMSLFVILGMSGLFCPFSLFSMENPVSKQCRP